MAGRRKHRQFMESFPSQPDTMRSPPDPKAGRYSTTLPRREQQWVDTTAFTEDQSWGRVAIFRDPDESAPKIIYYWPGDTACGTLCVAESGRLCDIASGTLGLELLGLGMVIEKLIFGGQA